MLGTGYIDVVTLRLKNSVKKPYKHNPTITTTTVKKTNIGKKKQHTYRQALTPDDVAHRNKHMQKFWLLD